MTVEEKEWDNDDDDLVLEHKMTCFKISTYIPVRIINPHVPGAQLQKIIISHLV